MTDPPPRTDIMALHAKIVAHLTACAQQQTADQVRTDSMRRILALDVSPDVRSHVTAALEQTHTAESHQLSFYLMLVSPLLEAYEAELAQPIRISFMAPRAVEAGRTDQIIAQFMATIKPYMYILDASDSVGVHPATTTAINSLVCEGCAGKSLEYVSQSMCICLDCGLDQDQAVDAFTFKDNDHVNITSKYLYERRTHFRDCVKQFQGKQNAKIHEDVYTTLRREIQLRGWLLPGTTKEEQYANVTKRHIYRLLKDFKFSTKYNEDLHLIYHVITGKPLDDITHLEDILIRDFDILAEEYHKTYIKTKEFTRKNFIHTQYVLFQLLRRHNYPCNQSDFNLLKTLDRRAFHDEVCSRLFSQLDWKFTHLF